MLPPCTLKHYINEACGKRLFHFFHDVDHIHMTMESFKRPYNINVGVLGHVDSGKTSLVAALSTILSTAALDKHPQSKERGITLDLGFSSFILPLPKKEEYTSLLDYDEIQYTLVDCPGHASLMRTVVAGAQIMDIMVLVVDVTKGIQTQTAECIVLGEITADHLVVVLNKTDLLDPEKKEKHIKKARKLIASTLTATKFSKCPIIAVSARRKTEHVDTPLLPGILTSDGDNNGIELLKAALQEMTLQLLQSRTSTIRIHTQNTRTPTAIAISSSNNNNNKNKDEDNEPFLFYIDHCFMIKGQGTILTGTVARGSVSINDIIELPALKLQKKVKSMQMFRKSIKKAHRGDRLGICVTQLDAKVIERGLACLPGSIPTFQGAVAPVEKVRFYGGDILSQSKIHVLVGHNTVMAKVVFFGEESAAMSSLFSRRNEKELSENIKSKLHVQNNDTMNGFEFEREYLYQEKLYGFEGRPLETEGNLVVDDNNTTHECSDGVKENVHRGKQWVYLVFDEPVTAPPNAHIIGAKLDADLHTSTCRIAFYGRLCAQIDPQNAKQLENLRVYKVKKRQAVIERVDDDGCTAICKGMFSKESDLTKFIGMKVVGPRNELGVLQGRFGKSGKFKVRFLDTGISLDAHKNNNSVYLMYKRFVFDIDKKKITQQT